MKTMLFTIIFLPFAALSQSFDNYLQGYVAGARIDTVQAQYAQAEYTLGAAATNNIAKRFTFRWNQPNTKNDDKLYRLTDVAGEALAFPTTAAALNFFYLNGWELVDIYPTGYLLRRYRSPK